LSEREIISNIFVIIFGGLETTAAMFSNTVWALLNHPDQFDEVKRDPARLMKSAVEETLRWESPVQTATRHVTKPITVRGVDFAVGDTVQCMLGAPTATQNFSPTQTASTSTEQMLLTISPSPADDITVSGRH
jgi:cytochrome P450